VRITAFLFVLSILIAACAPSVEVGGSSTEPTSTDDSQVPTVKSTGIGADATSTPSGETSESPRINHRIDDPNEYSFPQLLPWDGIRPVYNPQFTSADEAGLAEEELIIGIAMGDEAKAYPITVLRFREMVNDELAGIPILVTW
jgi:hypothetical protein